MYQLSASLQCMDFKKIKEQIQVLNKYMDRYHIDVFDGHFVPNIVFGPEIVTNIQDILKIPFDVHLAVEKPEIIMLPFLKSQAETISIHIESLSHQFFRVADKIHSAGKKFGIVLSPITGIDNFVYIADEIDKVTVMTVDPGFAGQKFIKPMLKKIKTISEFKKRNNCRFQIEVDGSVNLKTIKDLYISGAEVFVLGSSGLFDLDKSTERAAIKIKNYFKSL